MRKTVFDTLTDSEKLLLLNGEKVGLFNYCFRSGVGYNDLVDQMCVGYYLDHSGNKPVSVTYERIEELAKNTNKDVNEVLGNIIKGKFSKKWDLLYTALNTEYDVVNNVDIVETKTGNNVVEDTYNSSNEKTGNNSDTTSYNTTVTDNGKKGMKEITTRGDTVDDTIFGFNSATSVGDTSRSENLSETVESLPEFNTSFNEQIKTGTDSKEFGINETDKHTGTDTKTNSINESTSKNGRTENPSANIESELLMRNKFIFFDTIYKDIDSIVALQIYI